NWVNAADSTDHHVPTASDDAVIDNTYMDVSGITVAVNGSDSVNSLNSQAAIRVNGSLSLAAASTVNNSLSVGGASLTVAGTLVVTGHFGLAASTLSGSGAINVYGGTDPVGGVTLDGVAVNNEPGSTTTLSRIGGLGFAHGAVFNNLAGATFD